MPDRSLRRGVAGLGRGFTVMLPTLAGDPRVQLVAAADPRPDARQKFAADFGATSSATAEELCADPSVEVVYVATPHELHAAHVCAAAAKGKHVLVEKPMAITLHDCQTMIAAARQAKGQLIVGHSHSFNAPVRRCRGHLTTRAVPPPPLVKARPFPDLLRPPARPRGMASRNGGRVRMS